ncbi:MAG: hypothetical protein QM831_44040 [Kofleriaceae bacterium]
METTLETIRLALAADATADMRVAGITACRAILATLDPPVDPPAQPQRVGIDASQITALVGALRGVPADQLLDLAIGRLRAALPADANTATPKGISFHIVPINQ